MANINKYGEIDEAACPGCGSPIKPKWAACPECGKALKEDKKSGSDRFICPGCGESATAAQGAVLCKTCEAFVHRKCCVKGKCVKPFKSKGFFALEHEYAEFEYLCPICSKVLKIEG